MRHIEALRRRPWLHVVGLMSGTSADGVDAALVRVAGHAESTSVSTLACLTVPYPPALRRRLLELSDARAEVLCRANVEIGELFADAALAVVARAGLAPSDVHLVGSHGQTVVHVPGEATLQIGAPAVIAERTGLPVVADFRMRDVAAGGEGAPLVPWADWLLLRPPTGSRLAQNLGGVGNVTLVTQDPDDVVAFDTGPANAPLDAAAALLGGLAQDPGGAGAARGRADDEEVARLLGHPFLARSPPKSLDRATFGAEFVAELVARRPELAGDDLLATLTEFVVQSIARAYRDHLPGGARPVDVVVSGGGIHNTTLMARLAELLSPLPVKSSAEAGIDPDAKEAVAFAVLANETLHGCPSNLPAVTGARRRVVLGTLTP